METNKIYLGDALEVLQTFPDNCVDLVITDPPYEQSVDHGSGAFGVEKKISFKQIVGISNGFDPVILDELCRVMKKTNPVPTCNNKFLPDTEFCLFFREPGVFLGGTVSTKSTYYLSPSNKRDKELYGHPTPKPLPLIEKFVKNSSREGDIILDPFMGSGTTAEAALKNGRLFVGVELNPEYVKTAQMRIKGISKQLTLLDERVDYE